MRISDLQTKDVVNKNDGRNIGRIIDMDILENGFLPAIKLGGIKILKTTLEKFLIENEGNDLSDPKNLKKMVIKEVDSNGQYKYQKKRKCLSIFI